MNNSQDITVTEGRTRQAVDGVFNQIAMPKVDNKIRKAAENERIRTGVITRFYPYIDKAEVKLDYNNTKVLCKILHRYGGELLDFFTPLADRTGYDENLREEYIVPRVAQHVLVLKIHDSDSDENLILGYYQNKDLVGLNPAKPGNMKLSAMGITNEYWIKFGLDGLSYKLPERASSQAGYFEEDMETLEYYTKEEVDEKLKSNECCNIDYSKLLTVTENYKEIDYDNKYYLFRGDCWTINNNYESSAAITSETFNDLTVKGTFRTKNDMVGLYWNSKDLITHPYISYGERVDYTDVILEFDYTSQGCMDFHNGTISITIGTNAGEVYYLTMNRFIEEFGHHVTIDFSNLTLLAGNTYLDRHGNEVVVEEDGFPVPVTDIKFIMFVIIPTNYEPNNDEYTVMANVDYEVTFSNIDITNGADAGICNEHVKLDPHPYRLCEGYDDFYNFNPMRITKEMRKLGYVEWVDLYIGASHFYEKSGNVGDVIDATDFNHTRTEKMVLNKNVPLNKAFIAWLDCYSRELKNNDCPNLVVSVSMENLQCPQSWRQKDANGNFALTGWVPSTFFYSPCHPEVAPYMQSVSEACLDIVVGNGMQPILQMGEAWWWWNENDKHPDQPSINQPPCLYDDSTKAKYLNENGEELPVYTTSWDTNFDEIAMYWLNLQLCSYSDALREVVKQDKYENGLYMALFFPPSVLDGDRVPKMMQQCNYLENAYNPSKLDVLQIEDYDWVTGLPQSPETKERDKAHHPLAYTIGQKLGFTEDRLHYFGGFVQYEKDAVEFWREIKKAMNDALDKNFKEVYVWAGSQVRRDHKILGYDDYELVQKLMTK